MPSQLCAIIDLKKLKPLPIFQYIQRIGNIKEEEMLSTFNCGVGLIIVVSQQNTEFIMQQISNFYDCYEIGKIEEGEISVSFENHILW